MLGLPEVNENACPAEQNLPGTVSGAILARAVERVRKEAAAAPEPGAVASLGAGEAVLAPAEHGASQLSGPQSEAPTLHTGTAEAVRRAVESAFTGLQKAEVNSVALVLKPDANTQLALHVRLQQGHLEALAVLERGNFAALGAEWKHLQDRLAEQGVRLAPLVSANDRGMSFSSEERPSARQDPSREQDPLEAEDTRKPAGSRPAASATNPGARARSASARNQWWA